MKRTLDAQPEIALVGPVAPYRGGISQYNTALFHALSNDEPSTIGVSYSRQYPKLLYPGKLDTDPNGPQSLKGIEYSIDSLRPDTWWSSARSIALRTPKLAVFHWWTFFWAPCVLVMMSVLQKRGVKVCLICHNLSDHDGSRWKSAISRRVIRQADAYLVHSRAHRDELAGRFPGKPVAWHPIPVYAHYPSPKGLLPKRGRLELLFFGFIRPYKGLDVLLQAISILDDADVYVTVVGEPWNSADTLMNSAKALKNVELHLSYVDDASAAEYFERADAVVLPYRSATGSAVVSVAFRYDKPVIASRVGGLPDVVTDRVNGMLVEPSDPQALASLLASLDRERLRTLTDGVREFKRSHDWHSLGATLRAQACRLQAETIDE